MRWREVKGPTGEMTGLWKVRGMGVEAVMGGVFTSQVRPNPFLSFTPQQCG